MDNKKIFIFVLTGLFAIFLLQSVSAAANVTLVTPANYTNSTGTMNINCTTGMHNALFAIIWYNYTHGVADGSVGANVTGGWNLTNQTTVAAGIARNFTNSSVIISGFNDATNYSFWCEVANTSGIHENSSIGIMITGNNSNIAIDNTAPAITLPVYTNATAKKNSTTLTLNISVIDATIGLNWSMCLIDVNGTNQTIVASAGWCNGTIGLRGLTDGYHTLQVYVNDTVNNIGLNESFVVQADTTAPVVSASCSPLSVIVGNTVTCSYSGSDATSGINSSLTTVDSSTPDVSVAGTFTYSCSFTDNAGNSASTSVTYIVRSSDSGGTTESPAWLGTHGVSDEAFEKGYTREIGAKQRVRVRVGTAYHYIGVLSLTETKATIEITSDPIQVILGIGEDVKVDVTDDGFYDIYVILNSIANNKADVTMQKIHEEIPAEEGPVTTTGELEGEEEEEEEEAEETDLTWLWIAIGVVVLAAIIGGGIVVKKKSKQ